MNHGNGRCFKVLELNELRSIIKLSNNIIILRIVKISLGFKLAMNNSIIKRFLFK